jgi:hypothetical protein
MSYEFPELLHVDGTLYHLHAYHGDRRHVGYPSRQIVDDEIVLEVKAGRITRAWWPDLRRVPDQTDEEFKLSVPEFLWPARLRGGKAPPGED